MNNYQNKDWLYQKYWKENLSQTEIAKLCNFSRRTVSNWMKKFGIGFKTRSEAMKGKNVGRDIFSIAIKKRKQRLDCYWSKLGYNTKNTNWDIRFGKNYSSGPNKLEKRFNLMTSDKIYYVGNRDFKIKISNGCCRYPDFKITGQNKIIEIFGDYWHRGENPQELIGLYKQAGFDCLIIWEHEIYNQQEMILKKVNQFIEQ